VFFSNPQGEHYNFLLTKQQLITPLFSPEKPKITISQVIVNTGLLIVNIPSGNVMSMCILVKNLKKWKNFTPDIL
jgi:hypothetical protein